ncbi:hypothetical protein [Nitrososphaera sp.]|uniref:hypothetical protein n=1 Tax=Nitrososphaera sp. TaxID=1971748 RepID=UPI0017DFE345|nr:hypothetical protein [Nitrososphaera sp.]NWG37053.1 hypothetical protein [Nitrososphaera sp.]
MSDNELKELQDIKKLLVVQLLVNGVAASDLAELIGMDPADFSRAFPARKLLKNLKKNSR